MREVFDQIDRQAPEYVRELAALLRQPSISARGEGIEDAAKMVEKMLEAVGANVSSLSVEGSPPVICGEIAGETRRAILFYNHYDVQPPEPVDRWTHEPFGAEIDAGKIYARGSADNKGDFVARVKAVEALLAVRGRLPVTVKFVVEGEEEIGSPHLERIAAEHPRLFEADACIWETGGRDPEGRIEITLGCKGLCYAQVEVEGASFDLHSSLAAIVPSPAWRLAWALGSLKNDKEEILIPGFYDDVRPPTADEAQLVENLSVSQERLVELYGVEGFVLGLSGRDVLKRLYFEPTCNICGLSSGYEGPGSKTVLPNHAMAKIDMRLGPDQRPGDIARKFENHLRAKGFADFKVTWLGAEHPVRTDPKARVVGIVREVVEELYGHAPCVYPTAAGTGPMFQVSARFGTPAIGLGIGNAHSRVHGPDENVNISDFLDGIKCMAAIIEMSA